MQHRAVGLELRQALGNSPIQDPGPLAAAKNQDAQGSGARSEPGPGRIKTEQLPANRIAGLDAGPAGRQCAGKGQQDAAGKKRQQPVCVTGHRVLFMDQQRHAGKPGRQAAGRGNEAAHAERHAGPDAPEDEQGLKHGAANGERRQQPDQESAPAQAGYRHPFHRDARRRFDARLEASAAAQPDHANAPVAQGLGNRQRRENVPSCAAGHDHHRTPVHRRLLDGLPGSSTAFSRSMRNRMPSDTRVTTRLERP